MLYAVNPKDWTFTSLMLQVCRWESSLNLIRTDESNLLHSLFKRKSNINMMLNTGVKYCNLLEKKLELAPFPEESFNKAFRILIHVHRRDLCEFRDVQAIYTNDSKIGVAQYWEYLDLAMRDAIISNTSWVVHSKDPHNINRMWVQNHVSLNKWLNTSFESFQHQKVLDTPKNIRFKGKINSRSKSLQKSGNFKKNKKKKSDGKFKVMIAETNRILKEKYPNNPNKKWDNEYCGFWNTCGCTKEDCTRQHACPFCYDENHKAGDCPHS